MKTKLLKYVYMFLPKTFGVNFPKAAPNQVIMFPEYQLQTLFHRQPLKFSSLSKVFVCNVSCSYALYSKFEECCRIVCSIAYYDATQRQATQRCSGPWSVVITPLRVKSFSAGPVFENHCAASLILELIL